jgi:hypothetical protein
MEAASPVGRSVDPSVVRGQEDPVTSRLSCMLWSDLYIIHAYVYMCVGIVFGSRSRRLLICLIRGYVLLWCDELWDIEFVVSFRRSAWE